jgi:uncharacterized protein (TIGR02147 family)
VDIFEYELYKTYINDRLDNPPGGLSRGLRTKISKEIGCQTAFTAQVLRGNAHFSLEQAEKINEFFGHSEEEGEFLLLLIQRERAGSEALKKRFEKRIKQIRQGRRVLSSRLDVKQTLSELDQVKYYSSWYYSAIHALVSVPEFQSAEKMAARLGLSVKTVAEVLEFFVSNGILLKTKSGFQIGTFRLHLGDQSNLITKHHSNWRLQALKSLDRRDEKNLHYSSAVSMSDKDVEKVNEILIKTIQQIKEIIKKSKEETTMALNFDFFKF